MFIEDRFDGGPRLSLSFHGFVARKLNLSAHRIEVQCFGIPVPRSGTSSNPITFQRHFGARLYPNDRPQPYAMLEGAFGRR